MDALLALRQERGNRLATRLQDLTGAIKPVVLQEEGSLVRIIGIKLEAIGCQAPIGSRCQIITDGGTFLGTSRDKPHKMLIGGRHQDMTEAIVETYQRHHLDGLVCLGGGGTQKNALRLKKAGLNVVTLPEPFPIG